MPEIFKKHHKNLGSSRKAAVKPVSPACIVPVSVDAASAFCCHSVLVCLPIVCPHNTSGQKNVFVKRILFISQFRQHKCLSLLVLVLEAWEYLHFLFLFCYVVEKVFFCYHALSTSP